MNKDIINLDLIQLSLTYLIIILVMVISNLNGIDRKKDIIIATFRMTVQLFISGFILVMIFGTETFIFPLLMLLVMEIFAIYNVISNIKENLNFDFKKSIAISIFTGTSLILLFFLIVVVRVKPFYKPQYLIPIAGMIIGNSMTGVNLALKTLLLNVKDKRDIIEASLMLGANPKDAINKIIQESFDTAIMPTINSMKNMGIISLPGMMTGQILSGTSPLIAIKYQIAIMIAIAGAVSISVFLFLNFSYKNFFNEKSQLIF